MLQINKIKRKMQRGFTLLEVLLVVAVIAILAGIVIIAINPGKNLGDTRNAQRSADVTTILNAVYQYSLDNNGATPTIPATATEVCITSSCSLLVDLTSLTTNGKYLVAIPSDPSCPTGCTATNGGGYTILKNATTGRITVAAPGTENGKPTITVSR